MAKFPLRKSALHSLTVQEASGAKMPAKCIGHLNNGGGEREKCLDPPIGVPIRYTGVGEKILALQHVHNRLCPCTLLLQIVL